MQAVSKRSQKSIEFHLSDGKFSTIDQQQAVFILLNCKDKRVGSLKERRRHPPLTSSVGNLNCSTKEEWFTDIYKAEGDGTKMLFAQTL